METPKRNHKRSAAYLSFFIIGFAACIFMILQEKSPDEKIIGKWREVTWEYEMVNRNKKNHQLPAKEITENGREQIAKELIIHEAETWQFLPNGTLLLHKKTGKPTKLGWKLKGRGHVLKLHYNDLKTEYYDLSDLTGNKMTLYIDIEIQAKGIVRMTFEKIA